MLDFIKGLSVADILKLIITIGSIIFGIISFIKSRRKAINANEEFNFLESLYAEIINAMEYSEKTLSPLKNALGVSISSMKLDNVLQKVQNYCLSNNKPFDKEKIEKIINDLISFSKVVNNKKSV